MGQKEAAARAKADALGRVPAKTDFLDSIHAEFTHVGYERAGHVNRGEVEAARGPLSLGLGMGEERLEYYRDPLFFAAPKLEVRGIAGEFELYAVASTPVVPKTGETRTSAMGYGTLGAVWEPLPMERGRGMSFRLGIEFEGSGEEMRKGRVGQVLPIMGFGAALGYGNFVAYGIEEIAYSEAEPYSYQSVPRHHRVRAGLRIGQGKTGAAAEFFQTPFEKGGELSFTLKTKNLSHGIYGWYSRGWGIIGNEGGIGMRLAFGGGKARGGVKVERGFVAGGGLGEAREYRWSQRKAPGYMQFFRDAIRNSESLTEFAARYRGQDAASVLFAVKYLGGWNVGNYEAGSDEWLRELGAEGAFQALRKSIREGSVGGAGMCGNISALLGTFLRGAGWDAYSISTIGTRGGEKKMHVVTIAKDPRTGEAYLAENNGNVMVNPRGKVWPLVRERSRRIGVVPLGMYVYGKGNRVMGYYEADEKKLNRAMAGDEETLKDALLHSRPRKKRK